MAFLTLDELVSLVQMSGLNHECAKKILLSANEGTLRRRGEGESGWLPAHAAHRIYQIRYRLALSQGAAVSGFNETLSEIIKYPENARINIYSLISDTDLFYLFISDDNHTLIGCANDPFIPYPDG